MVLLNADYGDMSCSEPFGLCMDVELYDQIREEIEEIKALQNEDAN